MSVGSQSHSTFLDLLGAFDGGRASSADIFKGDGKRVRSLREARQNDPRYQQSITEAARFVADVYTGRRRMLELQEALTTSDFPNLFGDIIDRQLLANYRETPATYRNYCKIGSVPDFRTAKRFAMNNAEGVLTTVAQQAEYPEVKLTDAVYSYSLSKYGKRIPFAWEDMINDDLDALKDIPARFGRSARRTEEKFATQLFASSTGPNATTYSTANKNRVHTENGASANNPALSIAGLQDAILVLSKQVDADGEPILIEAVELVVPPALAVVAQNILNATEIWINPGGSVGSTLTDTSQSIHTGNWIKNLVRLNVNYYLSQVDTTHGNTAWYLFANPNTSRPALEVGFLRGHEEPEVFMKDPTAQRVGGGAVTPMDGDFDTDSLQYKVRHVLGGVAEDPKATVASNGSGS